MLKSQSKILYALMYFVISYNVHGLDANSIQISGVSDMLSNGESMLKFAAKWGGISTVICSALALGSGKLHSGMAQTICRVLVVIGLLIAAFSYFGNKINGFAF